MANITYAIRATIFSHCDRKMLHTYSATCTLQHGCPFMSTPVHNKTRYINITVKHDFISSTKHRLYMYKYNIKVGWEILQSNHAIIVAGSGLNPDSVTIAVGVTADGEGDADEVPVVVEISCMMTSPPIVAPSVWVKLWRRRSQLRRNTLPQCWQLYGLMSVCVSKCVLRLLRWLKVLPHVEHLCGDSWRWRVLWTANVRAWQNPLPQSGHLNGFSLEWMYLQQKEDKKWYTMFNYLC